MCWDFVIAVFQCVLSLILCFVWLLELLYHACVFLEQGGLWETAWTALKLILSLNLSLDVADVSAPEEAVLEEENKILEVPILSQILW